MFRAQTKGVPGCSLAVNVLVSFAFLHDILGGDILSQSRRKAGPSHPAFSTLAKTLNFKCRPDMSWALPVVLYFERHDEVVACVRIAVNASPSSCCSMPLRNLERVGWLNVCILYLLESGMSSPTGTSTRQVRTPRTPLSNELRKN